MEEFPVPDHVKALHRVSKDLERYIDQELLTYTSHPDYQGLLSDRRFAAAVQAFAIIEHVEYPAIISIENSVQEQGMVIDPQRRRIAREETHEFLTAFRRAEMELDGLTQDTIRKAEELAQELYKKWKVS